MSADSADSAAFDETIDGTGSNSSASGSMPAGLLRDRPLDAGQRVGEYVIEGIIGAGAFGTVYRAVHPLIGKPAAVKVLSLRYSVDPDIVARFVDEARAVNRISHPSIIDIFSFGTLPDGRCYYVMELLDGEPLDEMLQAGPLPIEDAVRILEPIAAALDAAHATGIAHRDLKPANIFVARHGNDWMPKLLDFGIAKLLDDERDRKRTASGATIGTPAYMAPEQCLGHTVDHRVDIYAFGVMAFEVLTGRLPFEAESGFAMMAAHLNDPPPAAHDITATVPPRMSSVLAAIMAKRPEDRPGSVGAAMTLLTAAVGRGGARPARTPGLRSPWPFLALGAALFAVVAYFALRDDSARIVAGPVTDATPISAPRAPAAPRTAPPTATPVTAASAAPTTAAPTTAAPASAASVASVSQASPATAASPRSEPPKPMTVTLSGAPRRVVARLDGALLPVKDGRITVPADGGKVTLSAARHQSRVVNIAPGETRIDARLRRVPRSNRPNRTPDKDSLEPWSP